MYWLLINTVVILRLNPYSIIMTFKCIYIHFIYSYNLKSVHIFTSLFHATPFSVHYFLITWKKRTQHTWNIKIKYQPNTTSADKESLPRVRELYESFLNKPGACVTVNDMMTAGALLFQFSRYIISTTSQKQTAELYTQLKLVSEDLEIWDWGFVIWYLERDLNTYLTISTSNVWNYAVSSRFDIYQGYYR